MFQDMICIYCDITVKPSGLISAGIKFRTQFHVLSEICKCFFFFFGEMLGMSEYLILWERKEIVFL